MVVRTKFDDGTDTLIGGDGPGKPRCEWFHGICTETPTKYIAAPTREDGTATVETFCVRHYVLNLAELLEVHGPTCEHGGIAEHIAEYGDLN